MDRSSAPKEHVASAERGRPELELLAADRVDDELFIAAVIEGDVKVAAVLVHVNPVAAGIDEESAGTRLYVFYRYPGRYHAADLL